VDSKNRAVVIDFVFLDSSYSVQHDVPIRTSLRSGDWNLHRVESW